MTAGGCGAVTAGEGQLQPPGLQSTAACHGLLTSLNTHQSSDISESGRLSPLAPLAPLGPLSWKSEVTRSVPVVTPNIAESEEDIKESQEDGEGICDDSLLGELSTMNSSSFSLSVDSNQIQPHQG